MLFRLSLKQMLRTPVKLIASFFVFMAITAFFCVGLNLKSNSALNIAAAEAAFTTVAVPAVEKIDLELPRGFTPSMAEQYINPITGALEVPEDLMERVSRPTWASEEDVDFSAIASLPGVECMDVRGRFGAYANGSEQLLYGVDQSGYPCREDVIIFSLAADAPVTVRSVAKMAGSVKPETVPVTVHFSANGLYSYGSSIDLYHFLTELHLKASAYGIPEMFHEDASFTLEPGKQYIAVLSSIFAEESIDTDGTVSKTGTVTQATLQSDAYHNPRTFPYTGKNRKQNTDYGISLNTAVWPSQLPIMEYNQGFLDTEEGVFYRENIDAYKINTNSLTAITTRDMMAMRPFHSGEVFIAEGRAISGEEHAEGAHVCIVSAAMAEYNGWQVGDSVSFSFFDCAPDSYNDNPDSPNRDLEWPYSSYSIGSKGFFDEGAYTIIGLFDGKVELKARKAYASTPDKLHAVHVIIPETAVENAPPVRLYEYLSSIRIENDKALDFLNAFQLSGLMGEENAESGTYTLGLTLYDQGYSLAAPGLNQLSKVSGLTLILSGSAAAFSLLVMSVIHVLQKRRDMAAMRSLGTKKKQVLSIALAGMMLVCCMGSAAGAAIGHTLSHGAAEKVLAAVEEEKIDTSFTAMMGEEEEKTFEFSLESDIRLAIGSWLMITGAFSLSSLLLAAVELRRPPIMMLGVKE